MAGAIAVDHVEMLASMCVCANSMAGREVP